jgi:hypothetical protein
MRFRQVRGAGALIYQGRLAETNLTIEEKSESLSFPSGGGQSTTPPSPNFADNFLHYWENET